MNLRSEIDQTFSGQAFKRPLFYSVEGGLRFELSEGDTAIEQFMLAMRKATEICTEIFSGSDTMLVCLKAWSSGHAFSHREQLAQLEAAGLAIPRQREIWIEIEVDEELPAEPLYWLYLAFEVPKHHLQRLLWCAFAADFGSIRPNPRCSVYLFNIAKRVMAFPYDDRGMDVVGPNHDHLAQLYQEFGRYLLDYDRPAMDAHFGGLSVHQSGEGMSTSR